MKRFYVVTICISIIVLYGILTAYSSLKINRGELLLKNSAAEEINNVSLKYTGSKKEVYIGTLKPGDKYMHKIEDERDDAIILIYTDSSGVKHEETAVSYVTKGIPGTTVIIKKTTDGKWIVESK